MISVNGKKTKRATLIEVETFDREEMLNNEEDEDDVSFYVQKSEPKILKSVSGLNIYTNLAEQRIKTTREPPATGNLFS